MNFEIGDQVVHCTHGLGQVMAIEERAINNHSSLYYIVQVADLSIWVPANEDLQNRLRLPTSRGLLQKALALLSAPAEALQEDHRQRGLQLHEMLKDGRTESLCRVIRDLNAFRRVHRWNDHDNELIKKVEKRLVREWSYIMSITQAAAETQLQHMLLPKAE